MDIKKIIKEELDDFEWVSEEQDEMEWMRNVPEDGYDVTYDNVYTGMKVKLKRDSTFYNQAPELIGEVITLGGGEGEITEEYFCKDDNDDEICDWVYVAWDGSRVHYNNYRIGPHVHDLVVTSESINEQEDEFGWMRDIHIPATELEPRQKFKIVSMSDEAMDEFNKEIRRVMSYNDKIDGDIEDFENPNPYEMVFTTDNEGVFEGDYDRYDRNPDPDDLGLTIWAIPIELYKDYKEFHGNQGIWLSTKDMYVILA